MASAVPTSSAQRDPRPSGPPGADVAAAYRAASGARDRRGATAYALLAAVLLLVTIPLDHVRFDARATAMVPIRIGGGVAMLLLLGLIRSAFGERHARALGVLAPAVVGVVQQALASVTG